MSMWREFWGQVDWPWPNAPLTRTSSLLERHIKGEISLHSASVVALVSVMGIEAARWLNPRIPIDRGRVAMCLVNLLTQSARYSSDRVRPTIAVTLAAFALAINKYPGGTSKPSSESRMHRALEMIRMYESINAEASDYEELLVFGLLGLLKDPEAYVFTSDEISTIGSNIAIAHRTDAGNICFPFLPHSFDLEQHLLDSILAYLYPAPAFWEYPISENTRTVLLQLLTLHPHIWVHDMRFYTVLADNLEQAESKDLQTSCLEAIGPHWTYTSSNDLLKMLFSHSTVRTLFRLLQGPHHSVAVMSMHLLRMMITKTLEILHPENQSESENRSFDANSALLSMVNDGLFPIIAELFTTKSEPVIGSNHIDMWFRVLQGLSQTFPKEILQSNVLTSMANFYESSTAKGEIGSMDPNGAEGDVADRLRALESTCMSIAPLAS